MEKSVLVIDGDELLQAQDGLECGLHQKLCVCVCVRLL